LNYAFPQNDQAENLARSFSHTHSTEARPSVAPERRILPAEQFPNFQRQSGNTGGTPMILSARPQLHERHRAQGIIGVSPVFPIPIRLYDSAQGLPYQYAPKNGLYDTEACGFNFVSARMIARRFDGRTVFVPEGHHDRSEARSAWIVRKIARPSGTIEPRLF
jgi:hypothetical protein